MKISDINIGDTVKIERVAIERHAAYVGQVGTVAKFIKSRQQAAVDTPIGRYYSNVENITKELQEK